MSRSVRFRAVVLAVTWPLLTQCAVVPAVPPRPIPPDLDPSLLPKASPDATEILYLQSNVNCQFFVDGRPVITGKRVRLLVSRQHHQVVCKPEGYRAKEEYVQPPFNPNHPIGFTFLIEDRLPGGELLAERPAIVPKLEGPAAEMVAAAANCRIERDEAIAILPFWAGGEDSRARSLGSALTESVIVDLVSLQLFRVVERARIEAVIREMRFGLSDLIDPRTAQSVGRLVGAVYIVIGSADSVGGGMQIVTRVLTAKGDNLVAVRVVGDNADPLALGRQAGAALVRQLKTCVTGG